MLGALGVLASLCGVCTWQDGGRGEVSSGAGLGPWPPSKNFVPMLFRKCFSLVWGRIGQMCSLRLVALTGSRVVSAGRATTTRVWFEINCFAIQGRDVRHSARFLFATASFLHAWRSQLSSAPAPCALVGVASRSLGRPAGSRKALEAPAPVPASQAASVQDGPCRASGRGLAGWLGRR